MTPEIYHRASDLFDQLCELSEEQLIPAVDAACAGDRELRAEVLRLLAGDRTASSAGFLERRALEDAARLLTPEVPNVPAPGTLIGNYRLGDQIGAGGMGMVFEGQDLRLNRRVAIKILPLTLAAGADSGADSIQRFQREVRAASTMNHPHIVSIFDADCHQGYHYIAMEFVEGKTLRQVARSQSPVDSHAILEWIGQVASALSAAHEAGIVHRDIKPENIMVRPDGFVKVLDFGLAKLRQTGSPEAGRQSDLLTRPGSIAGTLQYLSPEQVLGEAVGPRSDLFSLGVVAYELATGVRPFDGPSDGAVMNAIVNHTPPLPSEVRPGAGKELDALVMRALEKDPELRFQTAGDLRSFCRRGSRDYIVRTLEKDREAPPPAVTRETLTRETESGRGAASQAPQIASKTSRRFWSTALVAAACLAVIGAVLLWLNQPVPAPLPGDIVQITGDRLFKDSFVNDGTRLYYAAGSKDPEITMFQVGTKGGDPVPMPRLKGMFPLDISPDRSEMLLGQYLQGTVNGPYPIWVADTLGSQPRRVGDLSAIYARWSPKGDEIVYSNGAELRVARGDGSGSREVARTEGVVKYPAWSPNGKFIRFTLVAMNASALWEIAPDGRGLHKVFPQWTNSQQQEGVWTPNGKHFVFSARQISDTRDLWAVGRGGRLWDTGSTSPVRLVNGPMASSHPEISPDGRRVFFLGNPNRGELVRYDRIEDRWVPFLGGLAAMQLDYSRDGKWATYASCPQGSIWRIAADGTQPLQLTVPPLFARNPRWSPDGSQIVFYGAFPGKPDRIYTVPASGGAVRQLTHGEAGPSGDEDGSWSPDGAAIVFGAQSADQRVEKLPLAVIDTKTLGISKLPGTLGLWGPRWSPDGRYIAALGFPIHKIWLYNVGTQEAKELTSIGAGFPSWSRDSQYIYFEDNASTHWYRVRVADGKLETLASLKDLKLAAAGLGWMGLAPDGSLISTKDAGSTEIYALDWETP